MQFWMLSIRKSTPPCTLDLRKHIYLKYYVLWNRYPLNQSKYSNEISEIPRPNFPSQIRILKVVCTKSGKIYSGPDCCY